MDELTNGQTMFESIKHVDKNGMEFWYARELMSILEYVKWEHFKKVIEKAIISCKASELEVSDCFPEVGKPIISGKGKTEYIQDYKLNRYACYLIAQNGSPKKKAIALAQTYFAIQTRKQEITEEEYVQLTEDEKRLYTRNNVVGKNRQLFYTAKNSGVKNFGKFNNYGYRGLYDGETAKDIKARKNLNDRADILDYMGSEELGANLFRITQTDAILKKNNINNEQEACKTHHDVGQAIRQTIKRIGGTMPEDLPTPKTSTKQLEKDKKKQEKLEQKKRKKLK